MDPGALAPLPTRAAWRHHTAREAAEVVTFRDRGDGWTVAGVATGVEDGVAYALGYEIDVDADWTTRRATVRSLLPGEGSVLLDRVGDGWTVDHRSRPELDGLVDVDLECSAMTNTLPVHRRSVAVRVPGPAAYVRLDLSVQRLDQWYGPSRPRPEGGWTVAYEAPEFEADFDLTYDAAGLVVDYPGLATRLQ